MDHTSACDKDCTAVMSSVVVIDFHIINIHTRQQSTCILCRGKNQK